MTRMYTGPGGGRDLEDVFTYHPPTEQTIPLFEQIRAAGLAMGKVLAECTPPSPEASTALSRLRETVMWANAAVAIHGPGPGPEEPEPLPEGAVRHLYLGANTDGHQVLCGAKPSGGTIHHTSLWWEITCEECQHRLHRLSVEES